MAGLCHVCSAEHPKYRCPACGVKSCSLACSQTHKSTCEPRPLGSNVDQSATNNTANGDSMQNTDAAASDANTNSILVAAQAAKRELSALSSSTELQELLAKYPRLRGQLRDIYKVTLEEEWDDPSPTRTRSGHRGRGRGKGGHAGARREGQGPWTAEKGFNRGMSKVREMREEGTDGIDTEGFIKFVELVTADRQSQG